MAAMATLRDICFDCTDQHRVARFWAEVLGYTVRPPDPEDTVDSSVALDPPDGGFRIWCNRVPEPKVVKNRVHIDINLTDQEGIHHLERLGARVLREVRDEDDGALWWTIMGDPEGNEFCAFPPKG
ncbi:MAG TPA: VOC family protein [Chloroflexota bacterium]